jgi:hypothetical protein
MLCAWSSQYPHRPIPPDQSRSVEVNGTGSVVVPAPAILQGFRNFFSSLDSSQNPNHEKVGDEYPVTQELTAKLERRQ